MEWAAQGRGVLGKVAVIVNGDLARGADDVGAHDEYDN